MKKLLGLLLLLSCALAAPDNYDWGFATMRYVSGPVEITPSLSFEGDESMITIESTRDARAGWKLFKVIPHANINGSWDLQFDVRIRTTAADYDAAKFFSSGEAEENDPPHLFAFVYEVGNATPESPGTQLNSPPNFFAAPKAKQCHVHSECNYLGPGDPYCVVEKYTYQGWIYDGKTFGTGTINQEAFSQNEWKTVKLAMGSSECNTANVTIAIMGIDQHNVVKHEWDIKDVRLTMGATEDILLYNVWDTNADEYLKNPEYCGDNVQNRDEECDGTDGVISGYTCTADCSLKTVCGDGIVVGAEVCDSSLVTEGFKCSSDCLKEEPICGDNFAIPGHEVCDGTDVQIGFQCAGDCSSMSPVCGDGIVLGAEECDGETGISENYGCSTDCSLYKLLTVGEQAAVDAQLALMQEATEDDPAVAEVDMVGPGHLSIDDVQDQISLKGLAFSTATTIEFCTVADVVCEEKYGYNEDFAASNSSITLPPGTTIGLMKVYKSGATGYKLGFRPSSGGFLPYMDWTLWAIIGAIIFIVVVLAVLLVIIVGVYVYLKKKRSAPAPPPPVEV